MKSSCKTPNLTHTSSIWKISKFIIEVIEFFKNNFKCFWYKMIRIIDLMIFFFYFLILLNISFKYSW